MAYRELRGLPARNLPRLSSMDAVVGCGIRSYVRNMPVSMKPFSLYIHIPYCISKCPYCDFNSHVVQEIPEQGYTDALLRELEHYGNLDEWRGRTVQSIFFGGGTPSTFHPDSVGKLLA